MPRYDFKCTNPQCEKVFEVTKGMSEDGPAKCPFCSAKKPEQLISTPNIGHPNRPPWTYKEALKYKNARWNGGPLTKIDPNKHGDLASWNSPGEVIPEPKKRKNIPKRGGVS